MFYWIIPYLVAYNVSETANWKNVPAHYFEAEVKVNLTTDYDDNKLYTDVTILFICKPIDLSNIECHVDNATIDNYEIMPNDTKQVRFDGLSIFDEIISIYFNVEFDKIGITKISFPEPCGYYCENIIRTVIGNLNIGIDLIGKKFGKYVSMDKSINGNCETGYVIEKIPKSPREKSMRENLDIMKMEIASFPVSNYETIVITKERNMKNCEKKTSYFFGKTEEYSNDPKRGFKVENEITSSRSKIYLGNNRFTSYTEHKGTIKMSGRPQNSEKGEKLIKCKTSESIRLSLVGIDQATDKPFKQI